MGKGLGGQESGRGTEGMRKSRNKRETDRQEEAGKRNGSNIYRMKKKKKKGKKLNEKKKEKMRKKRWRRRRRNSVPRIRNIGSYLSPSLSPQASFPPTLPSSLTIIPSPSQCEENVNTTSFLPSSSLLCCCEERGDHDLNLKHEK